MVDLIAVLRSEFDYIVMDAPPLLPVVDALALATVADKILVIVEWCQTSRASIYEAFKVLGPEVTASPACPQQGRFQSAPGVCAVITIAPLPSTSQRMKSGSLVFDTVRRHSTIGYLSPVSSRSGPR